MVVATRVWTMELSSSGRLLPWLVWGERLGVGNHRVAGAGCWQITLLP